MFMMRDDDVFGWNGWDSYGYVGVVEGEVIDGYRGGYGTTIS